MALFDLQWPEARFLLHRVFLVSLMASFLPHDAMLARCMLWSCVCLSVSLSHADIVQT